MRDALSYREGGEAARRVEERRFRFAAPQFPNRFGYFLDPLPTGEEALEMVANPPPSGGRVQQGAHPFLRSRRAR